MLEALGDLLASVGACERCEKYADAVALEIELECQLRPGGAVEWFDGDGAEGAHWAVDAAERAFARWVMLCDLVADVAWAAGHAAFVGGARTDPGWAVGFDLGAFDLLLPLAVPAEIIDVGEDLVRGAVDLDAVDDRGHLSGAPD